MALARQATDSPHNVGGSGSEPVTFEEFSRSGIFNMFLHEQTPLIRDKMMDWDSFFKANLISEADLQKMKSFDKQPFLKQEVLIKENGVQYLMLMVEFLQKIVRADTVQYLLMLFDESLGSLVKYPEQVKRLEKESANTIFSTFTKLLQKEDEYTQLKAAKLIAELLSCWNRIPDFTLTEYLRWIAIQLNGKSKTTSLQDMGLQCLQAILRHANYRKQVYNYPELVSTLVEMIKAPSPSPQLLYQIFFCFWTLSSLPTAAAEFHSKYDLIPFLLEACRSALKEKVIRVAIATLRNMVSNAPETTVLPMIGNKTPKLCENFMARKWSDEDIKTDVEFILKELQEKIQSLSTWDEYSSEVRSGKLEWSPVHQSQNFWKENAQRLNEKDYELLRILVRVLCTSPNSQSIAVACHDIGQYVHHYPGGKKIIQDFGAKQQVMELMTHESAEVRYHALAAVQNYMTNAWDF